MLLFKWWLFAAAATAAAAAAAAMVLAELTTSLPLQTPVGKIGVTHCGLLAAGLPVTALCPEAPLPGPAGAPPIPLPFNKGEEVMKSSCCCCDANRCAVDVSGPGELARLEELVAAEEWEGSGIDDAPEGGDDGVGDD